MHESYSYELFWRIRCAEHSPGTTRGSSNPVAVQVLASNFAGHWLECSSPNVKPCSSSCAPRPGPQLCIEAFGGHWLRLQVVSVHVGCRAVRRFARAILRIPSAEA